ncbi:MAG: hypothetical protein KatS3mg106_362 [Gemmataceae bacterium]|nr:MAG: hypothetical protein KatS3mg106_362 [Gemmataceae bacterium]
MLAPQPRSPVSGVMLAPRPHPQTAPLLRGGFHFLLLFSCLAWLGCGVKAPREAPETFAVTATSADVGSRAPMRPAEKAGQDLANSQKSDVDPKLLTAEVERKIIYTAHIDVVVKDLEAAMAEVKQLIHGHKGYIAKSEVRGQVGQRRTAEYVLRVPVNNFNALQEGLLQLGFAERNALESQDVTEEYVDIEARLQVLKREEETLNKLLLESRSRSDLLQTRDHILQVRSQIERAQARLNLLSRLTAFSTIYLKLREEQNYQPPASKAAPTLGERIRVTFRNSWDNFLDFLTKCTLLAVALTPWLPVIIPAGLVLIWLRHRRIRARVRNQQAVQPPSAPVETESA